MREIADSEPLAVPYDCTVSDVQVSPLMTGERVYERHRGKAARAPRSVFHFKAFAENVLVGFEDRIDTLSKELVHLL